MNLPDPIRQPQRFMQQVDALMRQNMATPGGPDAFDQVNAHLEASFEQVLSGYAPAEASAEPAPSAAPSPLAGRSLPISATSAAVAAVMQAMPGALSPGALQGYAPGAVPGLSPMMGAPGLPMGLTGLTGEGDGTTPWPLGPMPGLNGLMPTGPARPPGPPALPDKVSANWSPIVEEMSGKYQVPAWLISNVMRAESAGNPLATSQAGAMGLMQLMPDTALGLGVEDPYDPRQNIEGGAKYLRQLLDQFGGDLTKAVAAYNAGPGNVLKHGGVPPFAETQAYVRRVLG